MLDTTGDHPCYLNPREVRERGNLWSWGALLRVFLRTSSGTPWGCNTFPVWRKAI